MYEGCWEQVGKKLLWGGLLKAVRLDKRRMGRECFQGRGIHCEQGGGPTQGGEKRGHQAWALEGGNATLSSNLWYDFKGMFVPCWPSVDSLCDAKSIIRQVSVCPTPFAKLLTARSCLWTGGRLCQCLWLLGIQMFTLLGRSSF